MTIRISCPSCDKVYNLDDSMRGKKIRCKECAAIVPVPAGAGPTNNGDGITEHKPAPSAPAARRNRDGDDDERPARKAARRDYDDDDEPRARKSRRDDEHNEDDDYRPRRHGKEKKKAGSALPLILIGSGILVLVLVVVAVIFVMSGAKDNKMIAQAVPAVDKVQPQPNPDPLKPQPMPQPVPQPVPPLPLPEVQPAPAAPVGPKWNVPVGAAPEHKAGPVLVQLPDKLDYWEATKALVINPVCRKAALGLFIDNKKPGTKNESRIVVCDLAKAQVVGQANVPGAMVPLALSDDGTQVLLKREEPGPGNQDRLEVWNWSGQGMTKKQEFFPYGEFQGEDRNVRWAAFLSDNRLITMSSGGKVIAFDAPGGKALFKLDTDGWGLPALSPDRKMLAYATKSEFGLYDLDAGKPLGIQRSPGHYPWPMMTFSPSGKRFACATINRFVVLDTATGVVTCEIPTGINPMGKFTFTSEKHILVGGTALFDVDLQFRVWDYKGHDLAQSVAGLTSFVVHGGGQRMQGALVAVPVPQPTAEQAMQKAAADPAYLVFRPGTTVRLDVSGLPDPVERDKTAAALAAQLKKIGCEVAANGTIDLVASADIGKELEIAYYSAPAGGKGPKTKFGPPGFGKGRDGPPPGAVLKHAKIVEHYARLKFVFQGQPLWERSALNIPNDIRLEEGETVQEHLRKREHPNYAFYQTVELPRVVLRNKAASLGTSELSLTGLQ